MTAIGQFHVTGNKINKTFLSEVIQLMHALLTADGVTS